MTTTVRPSSLQVGVDVPWVTSWTAEPILGVRPCLSVGGRAAIVQAQQAGLGKPEYSKNHLVRQRWSVARMLCPMCGRPTTPDDRWTQIARRLRAGRLRAEGRLAELPVGVGHDQVLLDAGSIAPLHKTCVDQSLMHCPHLKAHPDVRVMRFPRRWAVWPLMVEGSLQATAIDIGPPPPVIAFLQLCGITDANDPRWRMDPYAPSNSRPIRNRRISFVPAPMS